MEWKRQSYEDLYVQKSESMEPMVGVPLEVPVSLRENELVMFAMDIIPVERYGYGADIVSAGLQRVWNALQPGIVEYSGLSERYQLYLDLVGASDFSRSLLEVRTIGQKRMLESLVDRAVSFIPKVVDSERQRDELEGFISELCELYDSESERS